MRRLVVKEHERIAIGVGGQLSAKEASWLQRYDESHARRTGDTIFTWSRSAAVVARGYVGVVQIPGVSIEILPKTDAPDGAEGAQRNLLYMLGVAGLVHTRSRSLAELETSSAPLLDVFVHAFAEGLLELVTKGFDRTYVTLEDNLQVVRGRLVIHEHIRRNAIHKQNLFVRYDELSVDTPMNRILKAACRVLSKAVRSSAVLRRIRELLSHLDPVTDVQPNQLHEAPRLTRQNSAFAPYLDFARMVLEGLSPSPAAGNSWSFSVLFAMHKVFEAFVAEFVRQNAIALGLGAARIRSQARGKHLMSDGREQVFELRPDLVGQAANGDTQFVLDTKWKLVRRSNPVADVEPGDAYQLLAYGERFDAPLCVLLYPAAGPARPQTFRFQGTHRIARIASIDVAADLRRNRDSLIEQLREVLQPGAAGDAGVSVAEHP